LKVVRLSLQFGDGSAGLALAANFPTSVDCWITNKMMQQTGSELLTLLAISWHLAAVTGNGLYFDAAKDLTHNASASSAERTL
jgi:hypothetical protein